VATSQYQPAEFVEAVLEVVESIPVGRVMSYGAIAECLGGGSPRRVGTIMALHGGSVPWHRVVTAAGRTPPGHEREARRRLVAEGVTFRGAHVDMSRHAWFPPDTA
jgi:alkylated DNA nucleotide flippase Atl1